MNDREQGVIERQMNGEEKREEKEREKGYKE